MADTFNDLTCPACGQLMKKVLIKGKNINIDICTEGCGGIFFDNREFKNFDEQHENIAEIEAALKDRTFAPVEEIKGEQRVCPACGANMVKNYSSIKQLVTVDECYSCGGKFLDYGELEKIRAEYTTDAQRATAAVAYLNNQIGFELEEARLAAASIERKGISYFFIDLFRGR